MSDTTQGAGFATLAIHAGAQPDVAYVMPSYPMSDQTPTSLRPDDLRPDDGSPASATLEERIATLEGGTAAVATSSGPAARTLALQALMQPGDELVAARRPGTGPLDPLDDALRRFGWHVRWADADKPESFVEALSDRTKAILVESIARDGTLTDIEAIAAIARRARVPLVVDNTLATPYLVRPFEHGADIVLHTATSLLAAHAGARAGLVVDGGSFAFADDERYPALSQPTPSHGGLVVAETYGNFAFAMAARLGLNDLGGSPAPLDAFLAAAGIETLALRLQRQCDNALAVARHLDRHQKVAWVRYAGLERDAGHALALRYCPRGAGAVLAFGLGAASDGWVGRLRLLSRHAEIGGARSLVSQREAAADPVGLAIGLEDPADIIADLDLALA